jgi:hypothetical protein
MRTNFSKEVNNNGNVGLRNRKAGALVRGLAMTLVALALTGIAFAQDDAGLKFKGGIGVIPVTGVSATTGLPNLNVVRGVNPAGPWRIAALEALVTPDGHIQVKGRGLLLAAGNGIGTNAGASVHATLFCGAATAATAFDEPGVALDADGDFTIDDFLTGSSPLPNPCANPVLLIRNGAATGQGVWFAAGIRQLDEN